MKIAFSPILANTYQINQKIEERFAIAHEQNKCNADLLSCMPICNVSFLAKK